MKQISMRKILQTDEAFLYKLFISSRQDLQCIAGINEDMINIIYHQQYLAEKLQLEKNYSGERFQIILCEDRPIGRFYVHLGEKGFRIIAIAILPEFRNQRIGTYVLEEMLKEASSMNKSVYLQVAWYNYLAKNLYEKLGFHVIEDNKVYCEMEWNPS